MASNATALTVKVSLDIDVNGEPVTRLLEMPASIEQHERGMTVHLHLDMARLARALAPELTKILYEQQRIRTDTRMR